MNKKKSRNRLGPVERTSRGFQIVQFKDSYGIPCSLQASSVAVYRNPGTSAVWLGCDDAQPKIMARDAAKFGIKTDETCGWIPYPIPTEVLLSTRMHLSRKQVAALVSLLQNWLKRGAFVSTI